MRFRAASAAAAAVLACAACFAGAAAAQAQPAMTVTPGTSALGDGDVLHVSGSGFDPHAAIVVVQCSAGAVSGGPDFCNERFVAVAPADGAGAFTARFVVHPLIETAAGTVDCTREACLLGAENLGQRSQLAAAPLSFKPLGPTPPIPPPIRQAPPVRGDPLAVASPGRPATLTLEAGVARGTAPGRIGRVTRLRTRPPARHGHGHGHGHGRGHARGHRHERQRGSPRAAQGRTRDQRRPALAGSVASGGPAALAGSAARGGSVASGGPAAPAGSAARGGSAAPPAAIARSRASGRVRGEGLLALTMSAPGKSWAQMRDTAVVADVRVDGGPVQQLVLFAGARPFTYEAFSGPLSTGRHRVSISIDRDLSSTFEVIPTVAVRRAQLAVVPRGDPGYAALAHSPVLYDRRIGARGDTPMITYADEEQLAHGARRITYVVTFSHEDAGTGFVPWLEWASWGRMSDIESLLTLTVTRRGAVRDVSYLGCKSCGADFPENRTALDETQLPFHGSWFAGHPILRVATGNNDASDEGTTALRVQQALAAPPRPRDTREGAMDRNPWTYAITAQEVRRERDDFSTRASSPAPGDVRQYLVLQLDSDPTGVASVGVDVRLRGDRRTFTNDFGTAYPLYTGGARRTVVKLPLAQAGRRVARLRLRVLPQAGATAKLHLRSIRALRFSHGRMRRVRLPRPRVVVGSPAPASSAAAPLVPVG